MKASPRDYLAITAALLAILLCGYGIGFLVGERTTRLRLAPATGSNQIHPDWAEATVERLARELALSSEQQAAVAKEVRQTATAIGTARYQAIRQYRSALIDLHQRLLPHLDAKQRNKVEDSRKQLQLSLDKDGKESEHSNK
jgi:VIT1/CCC1 family predicted Fe2+/Mn2+ transporter